MEVRRMARLHPLHVRTKLEKLVCEPPNMLYNSCIGPCRTETDGDEKQRKVRKRYEYKKSNNCS